MIALPDDIKMKLGQPQYRLTADFAAELSYGWNTLSATQNGNPLYWDHAVAESLTGGFVLPVTTLSLWMRPHHWSPGAIGEQVALQAHFDLKERLGLPEAIMTDNTLVFGEPVRPGDVISHHQVLRSVSETKTTRLGVGRFWVIDVEYYNQHTTRVGVESYTGFGYQRHPSGNQNHNNDSKQVSNITPSISSDISQASSYTQPHIYAKADPTHHQISAGNRIMPLTHDVSATTVVLGALASRDWRPMHHDYRFATERNGTRDIFLNTPNQAAWFERAITDWTGPKGRIGRMKFRMQEPVFPGDRMTISASVVSTEVDTVGCGWVDLGLELTVDDHVCTTCTARVALPVDSHDKPWSRRDHNWIP